MSDAMINVLNFAWMREHTGTASEQITLPDGTKTVGDLMPLLIARSAGHALALKNTAVRVAVNRSYGDLKTAVAAGDEIATRDRWLRWRYASSRKISTLARKPRLAGTGGGRDRAVCWHGAQPQRE